MKLKRPTTTTGYTYDPTTGATRSRLTRREMTVGEMLAWYGYWLAIWIIPTAFIVGGTLLALSGEQWAKLAGTLLYVLVVGFALLRILLWYGNRFG